MNNTAPIKYVITGGPGTGKTTLINELIKLGFQTVEEAARIFVSAEVKKKEKPLWETDIIKFQTKLMSKQLELESNINPYQITFTDRSCIDIIAYCRVFDKQPTKKLINMAKNNKYTKVFCLNFHPYYEQNKTRPESLQRAKQVHEIIKNSYKSFGYKIIEVKQTDIKERINFILNYIQDKMLIKNTNFFQKKFQIKQETS